MVVNKSDLVLVNASVLNPRPDKIQLTLLSALDLKIALPVRIEPITLDLFVRDAGAENAWGQAKIDGKVIKGNTTLGVSKVETPLTNLTTWEEYVYNVVFEKETPLSVKGVTNSYLGVLKSEVTMDKNIMSPGKPKKKTPGQIILEVKLTCIPVLNQFKGFSISDSGLIPAREDGTNLIGNASLPNPSVLTLDIGTIVLDVKSGDLVIGNATLKDITIKPGDNVFPLTGILDIHTMVANLREVLASQAKAIATGNLALDTVTRSVTWNGELVPYYTDVMKQLTLTANVPIADLVKNTVHNLLSGNETLRDIIKSGSDTSNLLGDLTSSNGDSDTASSALSGTSELASKMKTNVAVRDMFRGAHPVKRDLIINSLAGMYKKL